MALSDIVSVQITTESAKVEQAGFGIPLILATLAEVPGGFTERARSYTDLTGLAEDFDSDTSVYKMAATLFAQEPRLPTILVGRLTADFTQRWAITPVVTDSTLYEMEFNGEPISYESDTSASMAEVIAGLKSDIDALNLDVTVTDQTTYMRIVADNAGEIFNVKSLNVGRIGVKQDHADSAGLQDDLDAILLENNTWYAVLCPFNSQDTIEEIAEWAEANEKLFVAQTQDSNVVTVADGSDTTSVAATLKTSAYFRTALIYNPETFAFSDGGLAGKCLPFDPGSETWAFKTLASVPVTSLTSTQRTNAVDKYVTVYETVAGVNITEEGKVSGNEYIDVIRFRDWLKARIAEEVFSALANNKKLPFTDDGISVIQGLVLGVLRAGVAVGGLAEDPAPKCSVPKARDVSAVDKAARRLTGVKFDAVLAGAIHSIPIQGVISV